ncbi:MAG: zinc ribbon domain-containing protein [Candidatus Bathyarchaeota archaeon]|nr:MAG: zinc ribbon domain-containing protein [Candidatus Bathyarchaeota archaeon]
MHMKDAQNRRFMLARNLRRIGLASLIIGVGISAIGLLSPFQELFIGGYIIFLAGTAITSFAIVWGWLNTRSSKREDLKIKRVSKPMLTCPRCGTQTSKRRKYCPKCGKEIR